MSKKIPELKNTENINQGSLIHLLFRNPQICNYVPLQFHYCHKNTVHVIPFVYHKIFNLTDVLKAQISLLQNHAVIACISVPYILTINFKYCSSDTWWWDWRITNTHFRATCFFIIGTVDIYTSNAQTSVSIRQNWMPLPIVWKRDICTPSTIMFE